MKRFGALAAALLLCLTAGCRPEEIEPAYSSGGEAPVSSQSISSSEEAQPAVWTEEELEQLFLDNRDSEEWQFVACVPAGDFAYDRVGMVLYTVPEDGEAPHPWVAFFGEDGHFFPCGFVVELAEQPELTYLGDGAVSFQVLREDGTPYEMRLSFRLSEDGRDASFVAESDPEGLEST